MISAHEMKNKNSMKVSKIKVKFPSSGFYWEKLDRQIDRQLHGQPRLTPERASPQNGYGNNSQNAKILHKINTMTKFQSRKGNQCTPTTDFVAREPISQPSLTYRSRWFNPSLNPFVIIKKKLKKKSGGHISLYRKFSSPVPIT